MHIRDYERLQVARQSITVFVLTHLAGLIKDEGYGTSKASDALAEIFEPSNEMPMLTLADILAIRLCRQAAEEVCDRLEALATESS